MALSAGAEVDLWFFMLLSAWSWLLYLRKKTIGYAWLNAACFFLVSMTRYEAWLFILAFLPIQIWSINKKEGLSWKVLALPLLAVAYVIFFICYQEISLSSSKGILPLSWRGMRLYFRGEYPGAIRSFLEPLSLWFNFSPALTVLEISGAVYALVKRPELRGYILWISLSGLFLCLEAGIVGISAAVPGRLVVIFHLLQIPLICSLLEPLVPQKVPVWAGLIAPVAGMFFLQASMPRLTESDLLNHTRDGFIIAKAVHEVELAEYIRPHMLVERQLGPGPEVFDYTPMFFATFERFIGDRKENYNPAQLSLITENNPSVFSLKKGELERYLRQHHIGWIVTCSQGSLDALKGLSSPVATSGGRTLSAYQLPEYIVERARNVIKDVERSVNHDKNGF